MFIQKFHCFVGCSFFCFSIELFMNFSFFCSNAVNIDGGEVKPRSLRFTWSMKTTSSRDPNEIMAEIKKVNVEYVDHF